MRKVRPGWHLDNGYWRSGCTPTVLQCRSQAEAGHSSKWHAASMINAPDLASMEWVFLNCFLNSWSTLLSLKCRNEKRSSWFPLVHLIPKDVIYFLPKQLWGVFKRLKTSGQKTQHHLVCEMRDGSPSRWQLQWNEESSWLLHSSLHFLLYCWLWRTPLKTKWQALMKVFIIPSKTGHAFHYGVGSFMVYINYKTHKDKHIQQNRGGALKMRIPPVCSVSDRNQENKCN